MDGISHVLLGFVLGRTLGLDINLQLILIVASVSLDIDALPMRGRGAALRTHRGPLHSILVALVTSLLIGAGYAILAHLPVAILLSVIPICLTGLLSHLLLDIMTTGSMEALWPFSKKNFTLNLTYFIDPVFLVTLLIAALIIAYMKTDVGTIRIVTFVAAGFLILSIGERYLEKNAATRLVKRLDAGDASEIMSIPTIRPDRWWTVRKTPFKNGYHYEIYRVDSILKKILGTHSVESPYVNYRGTAELPIDSPQKAVACSRRDKTISASVDKFLLPAVSAIRSNEENEWQVLWHDAFTYAVRGERGGVLAHIEVDGTVTVEAR